MRYSSMESLLALLLCINAAVLPSICSDYEGNFHDLTDNIVNGKKLDNPVVLFISFNIAWADDFLGFSFRALVTLGSISHSDCGSLFKYPPFLFAYVHACVLLNE